MNTNTTLVADLLVAGAGKAALVTPKTDLFTAHTGAYGKLSAIGDFTLSAYTGYAQVTTVYSATYITQPENIPAWAASQSVFIGPSAGGPAADALGWVTHDGAGALYAWGVFDVAVPLVNTLSRVSIDTEYSLGGINQSVENH